MDAETVNRLRKLKNVHEQTLGEVKKAIALREDHVRAMTSFAEMLRSYLERRTTTEIDAAKDFIRNNLKLLGQSYERRS